MNPSQPLDRHSDYVGLRLLTRNDARAIKEEATLVLRSLRRRRYCGCDRPIRDEAHCAKCGCAFRSDSIGPRLTGVIREMDRLLHPPSSCPACSEIMVRVEGNLEFQWCEGCQRARAAA